MAVQLSSLTPDLVGRRYPNLDIEVTLNWAREFFECAGYPEKYFSQLQEGVELPFSFFSCPRGAEFKVFADLGIDLKQLLHISQTYSYFAKARIGDQIRSQVSIEKLIPKKLGGQQIVFLELRNQYYRGETLLTEATGAVIVRPVEEGSK